MDRIHYGEGGKKEHRHKNLTIALVEMQESQVTDASNASKSSAYVSRLASYFSLDFFETSFVFLKCIPQT